MDLLSFDIKSIISEKIKPEFEAEALDLKKSIKIIRDLKDSELFDASKVVKELQKLPKNR